MSEAVAASWQERGWVGLHTRGLLITAGGAVRELGRHMKTGGVRENKKWKNDMKRYDDSRGDKRQR